MNRSEEDIRSHTIYIEYEVKIMCVRDIKMGDGTQLMVNWQRGEQKVDTKVSLLQKSSAYFNACSFQMKTGIVVVNDEYLPKPSQIRLFKLEGSKDERKLMYECVLDLAKFSQYFEAKKVVLEFVGGHGASIELLVKALSITQKPSKKKSQPNQSGEKHDSAKSDTVFDNISKPEASQQQQLYDRLKKDFETQCQKLNSEICQQQKINADLSNQIQSIETSLDTQKQTAESQSQIWLRESLNQDISALKAQLQQKNEETTKLDGELSKLRSPNEELRSLVSEVANIQMKLSEIQLLKKANQQRYTEFDDY